MGQSWKRNPATVGALRDLAEGRSRGFSPRDIVDVLGIEVDGVDLTQGRAEAALFDVLRDLARAARTAAARDGVQHVALGGAPVELRLERAGEELRVSVLCAEERALVVRDIAVEPARFLAAVTKATRTLLSDLSEVHPGLAQSRVAVELARTLNEKPRERALRPLATPHRAGLVLQGPRRVLQLVDDQGEVLWTGHGTAARAVHALGTWLAAPVADERQGLQVDSALGTVTLGRAPPQPLATARAAWRTLLPNILTEAPTAQRQELLALATRLAEPVRHGDAKPLEAATSKRRLRAVKAPGLPDEGLRRLILRPAWRADGPGTRPRLETCAGLLLVRSAGNVEVRDARGTKLWSAHLGDARVVERGASSVLVGRDTHGSVVLLAPQTGARLARASAALHGRLRAALHLTDGTVATHDGARLVAFRPDGSAWAFGLGDERTLHAATLGAGLLVASDGGEIVALDAAGKRAWSGDCGLDVVDSVTSAPEGDAALIVGLDADGRVAASCFAVDGELRWRTVVGGVRPSEPLALARTWVVGHELAAGATLAGLDRATGRLRWRVFPPDDGHPTPVASGRGFVVARCSGGVAAYSSAGRLLWQRTGSDPDPALSPVRPRRPVVGAGLVVVPSALIHVHEASGGRLLASMEPGELAPESLVLLDGPVVVAAGRDGLLEAWRAAGHLSVVPLARNA